MGPLDRTARLIADTCYSASLVVIAGRNQALRERLEAHNWPIPTFIYGFVHEMPDFMRAADILVSKAGPGTISEALIAGLPMVLYSRLARTRRWQCQLCGFARSRRLGARFCPSCWTPSSTGFNIRKNAEQAVQACQRLARPHAARQIARILTAKLPLSSHIHPNEKKFCSFNRQNRHLH